LNIGYIPKNCKKLDSFRKVFAEFSVAKQLVLRGNCIVVPKCFQDSIVELAHIGHQGITKVKSYLRGRVWFPGTDALIEQFAESCISCQASTPSNSNLPDKPSDLPERPWQNLAMDFKGPIGKSFYFFLVIDEFSRFPDFQK